MMNTFSVLPRKTAHPPLVGNTARTCTSITVLFIAANGTLRAREKQASGVRVRALATKVLAWLAPWRTDGLRQSAAAEGRASFQLASTCSGTSWKLVLR